MPSVRVLTLAAVSIVMASCGSDSPETAPEAQPLSSPPTSEAKSELVGEWQRVTTCRQRVDALEVAGLGRFAAEHAAGDGWIPGVGSPDDLKDPQHPCAGAVPLEHTHFFTANGLFGSRDAEGDQVDDGTYEITDEDTVVIDKEFGKVTFNYEINDGQLYLDPVIPRCVKEGCFAAQWAVAVAYPGLPWNRRD